MKTIRKDGRPTKFPAPDVQSVNIVAVDVTRGAGSRLDRWDLELVSWGNPAVNEVVQRHLLGLFEPKNPYSPAFDPAFTGNKHLRDRIHALLFLVDQSTWHGPLNPDYHGFLALNPCLPIGKDQREAIRAFCESLTPLVSEWMPKLEWVQRK